MFQNCACGILYGFVLLGSFAFDWSGTSSIECPYIYPCFCDRSKTRLCKAFGNGLNVCFVGQLAVRGMGGGYSVVRGFGI